MRQFLMITACVMVAGASTAAMKITGDDRQYIFEPQADGSAPSTIVNPTNSLGEVEVRAMKNTTAPILVYMNQVQCNSTISSNFPVNTYAIEVASTNGFDVGDYVGVFSTNAARYYTGNILSISSNTLTMDTPSDFDYVVGDTVQCGTKEMNVDGSTTRQVFSLRADPSIAITADITRIIIHITDQTAMDTAKFGGIAALARGILLRRTDGYNYNIFNVKTNGEFAELAFDTQYDDKAPAGFYGFSCRLTFAGKSKIGSVIRLGPSEDLQLIIQDDLTDLDSFRIMVEGHIRQE